MADNIDITPGTGRTVATDQIGTIDYQLIKIAYGALDSATLVSPANPLPVQAPDITATGTLAAAAQTVALSLSSATTGGMGAATAQITGTWVGTITFEGTTDGANWVPINGVYAGQSMPGSTVTANGLVRLTPAGLASIRLNMTAWTSGTATITLRASMGAGGTFLNQSLPVGANIIGSVKLTDGTNSIAFATGSAPGNETTVDRIKVNAELKVLDTAQTAGSQIVAAKGDQTSGLWVNVKALAALPTGANTIGAVTGSGNFAITAAALPLPTGASTETTLAAASAKLPATLGAKAGSASLSVVAASDDYARQPANGFFQLPASAATNNLSAVKASAGAIKAIQGYNARSSPVYIKLFNLASGSVVAGTTAATKSIYIPATTGFLLDFPSGISFNSAISLMLTTGSALADNTAVALNDILGLNVDYI